MVDYYLGFLPDPAGRGRGCTCWPPATPLAVAAASCWTGLSCWTGSGGCARAERGVRAALQRHRRRAGAGRAALRNPCTGRRPPWPASAPRPGRGGWRLAGVPVLDEAEDLHSVEAVEAAARRLGERPPRRSARWSSSSTTASPARATPSSTWPASTARCSTRRWCSAPGRVLAVVRGQDRGRRRGRGGAAGRPRDGLAERAAAHPARRDATRPVHPQPGLGGPNRQVYLGCRFPADPAYAARSRTRPSGSGGSWPPRRDRLLRDRLLRRPQARPPAGLPVPR